MSVLSVPVGMLVVATVLFFVTETKEAAAQSSVSHTRAVQDAIFEMEGLVLDGETGIRGYMLTGDPAFLEPTHLAQRQVPSGLRNLAALVADNPLEESRVKHLQALLAPGFQLSTAGIPPASDPTARRAWLGEQKASTDQIRAVLASMSATEDSLLQARQGSLDTWRTSTRWAVGTALAIGVLGGVFAMFALVRRVLGRLGRLGQDAAAWGVGVALGEPDSSADELGEISRHLHDAIGRQRELEADNVAARRAAELANEEKTRFLSRMSHELRTPLNAVLGFAQLLEMDARQDQLDGLAQIRRAGRHLLELVNEVLDISAIESGRMTLSPEPVLVGDVVTEVLDMLAPMAAQRQVSLPSQPPPGCERHVLADRQRLRQVLLNLVSNAVKYNRLGGQVGLRCALVEADRLAIEIEDTGIGIGAEDLSRLFQPFERLSGSAQVEGTGIGLALSLRLAEAMGGSITVESTPGRGSTFKLVLPLSDGPPPDHQPVSIVSLTAGTPPGARPSHVRRKMLVIEDNLANVRLIEGLLARRGGWELLHAGHATLGIELARTQKPDLILLDLHLPDMPGDETLRRLKADPTLADTAVVIISADVTPGQVRRLLGIGATRYLTKPLDLSELLSVLDAMPAEPTEDA